MNHHLMFLIIGFLIALVTSNIINRLFPKIPLPFIQVLLGIMMAFLGADEILGFDPEVFLAFVIGPLLFREGQEADVPGIMKHWKTVVILVLPVVFVTAVVVGYVTHSFFPAVPLAACVAIGASLGPTDAVAVSSLSARFAFPKSIKNILSGEGLLNDASGLIASQFAILALITGHFSLANASVTFVVSALGGALVGFIVAWLNSTALALMEDIAAQDVVGYLLLELVMPLLAFSVAELFGFSGIIGAVVAGVLRAAGFKRITLFDAQVSKVSETVWNTIVFFLNGLVFTFLGIELKTIALPILLNESENNLRLLLTVVVLTAVLFIIRFITLSLYYKALSLRKKSKFSDYKKDIMLLTFAGVKGTVSIAAIMLIPQAVAQKYNIMIFTTAGVTLLSFLTGIIMLPLIATKKNGDIDNFEEISILNDVVLALQEDAEEVPEDEKEGYYAAIDNYTSRIEKLIIHQESDEATQDFNDLQLMILRIEEGGLEHAYYQGEISMPAYRIYHGYLRELERSIKHSVVSSLTFALTILFRAVHLAVAEVVYLITRRKKAKKAVKLTDETKEELRDLYLENTELILAALYNLEGVYDPYLLNLLATDRLRSTELVAEEGLMGQMVAGSRPDNLDEMTRGYYLERKFIAEYERAGRISPDKARELRINANTLEDYSMNEEYSRLVYDIIDYQERKN